MTQLPDHVERVFMEKARALEARERVLARFEKLMHGILEGAGYTSLAEAMREEVRLAVQESHRLRDKAK